MMNNLILTFLLLIPGSYTLANDSSQSKKYSNMPQVSRVLLRNTPSRAISVGYPNLFNYCFDTVSGSPLYVWTGAFIDLSPELRGRGGGACSIMGLKKTLPLEKYPFRVNTPDSLPEKITFLGYSRPRDNSAPVFDIEIDGVKISISLQSLQSELVEIDLKIDNKVKKSLFFKLKSFEQKNVVLSEGLSWQSKTSITIPGGVSSCKISLKMGSITGIMEKVKKMDGKALYAAYCSACHSLDGSKLIGPTLKGIMGKKEIVLANGIESHITVDENYLKRSILEPQKELVKGYELVPMPSFEKILKPDDVKKLVDFLKSLKK